MTAALILAAGVISDKSLRKPTDDIGGASSIKRIIMIYRQAGIKKIAVVTGYDAEAVENHCGRKGVVFLRNEDYETGDMLSSIKIGLEYLKDKCDKVFISPADVPFFTLETVKSMSKMSEQVVTPVCRNRTGHPLLLTQEVFSRVMEYSGSLGVEDALSGDDINRRFLLVPDEGILIDTQDQADILSAAEHQGLRKFRASMKIQLEGETGFFGPGAFLLLTLVRETGALKHAEKRMGISHFKAMQIITTAEAELGYKMLESRRGGGAGGTSRVSQEALDLMRRYEALEAECSEWLNEAFDRHFS